MMRQTSPHLQSQQNQQQQQKAKSVVYGHRLNKAKCLSSVLGDTTRDRFLVGTMCLHSDNEIHLIEYKEDLDDVSRVAIYSHPHEIWNIAPCPSRPNLFFTVYHNGKNFESSLWKLPANVYGDSLVEEEDELDKDHDEDQALDSGDDDEDHQSSPRHKLPALRIPTTANSAAAATNITTSSFVGGGGGGMMDGDSNLTELATISLNQDTTTSGSSAASRNRTKTLRSVLWQPNGMLDRVLTIDNEAVREWNIERLVPSSSSNKASTTTTTTTTSTECSTSPVSLTKPNQVYSVKSGNNMLFTGRWDPNHSEKVAVTASNKIIELDLRSNGKASVIENAHEQQVRCLEYNAYRSYYLVSGGDDCKMKFWDMRMVGSGPLRTVCGHSHWITQVAFNPLYDQLVLSSGSDSIVNLWSIPSISSKSIAKKMDRELNELEEDALSSSPMSPQEQAVSTTTVQDTNKVEEEQPLIDSLVCSIDEHEESVYSVAWSSSNKWVFGSVSYDGRVLVHTVPQSEKWKILNSE